MQNDLVESSNGRLREQSLNETPFSSIAHATTMLAERRTDLGPIDHIPGLVG